MPIETKKYAPYSDLHYYCLRSLYFTCLVCAPSPFPNPQRTFSLHLLALLLLRRFHASGKIIEKLYLDKTRGSITLQPNKARIRPFEFPTSPSPSQGIANSASARASFFLPPPAHPQLQDKENLSAIISIIITSLALSPCTFPPHHHRPRLATGAAPHTFSSTHTPTNGHPRAPPIPRARRPPERLLRRIPR